MLKKISYLLKALLALCLILSIITFSFVFMLILTEYKPSSTENLEVLNNPSEELKVNERLSIITFNLKYAGADKNSSFFSDGSRKSKKVTKEDILNTLTYSLDTLTELNPDFTLLQEVDVDSSRSHKINQYEFIRQKFSSYGSVFAVNYQAAWVPFPYRHPLGKLTSGQATLSKYKIDSSIRIALPQDGEWPEASAMAKRCILVSRFSVDNHKELVIYNIHFSDFNKKSELRTHQLSILKNLIQTEYAKGNYVIVGGDWNHLLPGSSEVSFEASELDYPKIDKIPSDFTPNGYTWVFDPNSATFRTSSMPYLEGYNHLYTIDGFLVSDNIAVFTTENVTTHFDYSDHNPIKMTFKLKR